MLTIHATNVQLLVMCSLLQLNYCSVYYVNTHVYQIQFLLLPLSVNMLGYTCVIPIKTKPDKWMYLHKFVQYYIYTCVSECNYMYLHEKKTVYLNKLRYSYPAVTVNHQLFHYCARIVNVLQYSYCMMNT